MQDGSGPSASGRGGRGRGGRGRQGQVMFARGGGGQRQMDGGNDMSGGGFPDGSGQAMMQGFMGMDGLQRPIPMMQPGALGPTPEMLVSMGLGGALGPLGPLGPMAGQLGQMGPMGPIGMAEMAAAAAAGQGFMPTGRGGMGGGGPMPPPGQPPGGGPGGGPMGLSGPPGMGPMGAMGAGLGLGAGMGGMGAGHMGGGMGPMGAMGMGMAGLMGPGGGMGGGMGAMGGQGMGGGGGGMGGGGGGGRGAGGAGGGGGAGSSESISNDYSQNFVDTGLRPQNYLRDSHMADRYEEYPKLKELISRKDRQVSAHATPPLFLRADLRTLRLSPETFGTKFDVILVDPPWEEYVRRAPGMVADPEVWSWQEIQALELEAVADTPCFLFLWCGAEEGLEAGRVCMQKWGFRRCEDICWIKTNKEQGKRGYLKAANQHPESMLVHTKEHCLMGIKGSVRRATDGHIIHTNVDTDVIVSEEPELGSTRKPEELYAIIERFCNGRRRLELFGEDHNIRDGWVTVGKSLTSSNFSAKAYAEHFRNRDGSIWVGNVVGPKPPPGAVTLVPTTEEIEALRPKSPPGHN